MAYKRLAVALVVVVLGGMVVGEAQKQELPDAAKLQAMTMRFAPVDIGADISALAPNERQALAKLVQAGRIMDALFLRQVWAGNEALLLRRAERQDAPRTGAAACLPPEQRPVVTAGPQPAVPARRARQAGRRAISIRPAQRKAEVEAWMAKLPEAQQPARPASSRPSAAVRTASSGRCRTAWNTRPSWRRAAELLREAAGLTSQPTLKKFLTTRADAFLSNDYYASDVAWMELDAAIEPTIGPYEVYEDEWFNYKAAFEAFITVRDDAETAKLAKFGDELQDIENHLPIDPKLRNPKLGALAPIRVVNDVLAAGDANRGVQTAAYNLPNDERVITEKGSKRVMLKNVQEAKFKVVLAAHLARGAVGRGPEERRVRRLLHPHPHARADARPRAARHHGRRQATTVRQELKDTYSAIEEAKADISGLWALQYLVDKGVIDKAMEQTMYTTFLASAFRSIRFGINEAHGRGIACS